MGLFGKLFSKKNKEQKDLVDLNKEKQEQANLAAEQVTEDTDENLDKLVAEGKANAIENNELVTIDGRRDLTYEVDKDCFGAVALAKKTGKPIPVCYKAIKAQQAA